MKILCIANEIDPKLYTKEIRLEFKDIQFILSSGNLPIEYLNFISQELKKPLYFVVAKHELHSIEKPNSYLHLLNTPILIQGLWIAGLSGAKKINNTIRQHTPIEQKRKINAIGRHLFFKKMLGTKLDILVSCSKSTEDTAPLTRLIKKYEPRIFIYGQGHSYNEQERVSTIKNTKLINVSGHYILDI